MSEYWSDILNHPVDKLAVIELTEFRLLDANAEFCSYFGHNRSELINKSFISFISRDASSGRLAAWNETLETSGFVKYHDKEHGRIIQIQRVIHDGKPYGFARVFDIATNKKVIEQELADSERRFKTLSDVTSEGVAFVQEGKLIDANDQLGRIFSYDDSREIIHKKLAEFIAVTDIQRIMASAEISVTNRNEVRATDRNGRPIFLEVTGSYLSYRHERTLVLVFDDISIRKRAEQALQQSLVSFQRLLEDSPNGVIILTEGKIQYLNQAACTLLEVRDEDEVFGDPFVDFIDDEFKSAVLEDIQKIRDGGEVEDKEIRIQNTSKEVIDVEIKSTLTVYENKPSIQITLNNISARNQLIQEQIRVRFVEEINSALKSETIFGTSGGREKKSEPAPKKGS